MSKLAQTTIAAVTITVVLVALVAALADPAGDGAQALELHRLLATGSLVLAVASALVLGMAIGRDAPTPKVSVATQSPAAAMSPAETEFLANMCHELRTPLNAVIGFAELILSEIHGPVSDRRYADYIRHIRTGGEQVLAMVNATLDLSQLAAGQLDLQPSRVEPWAAIEAGVQAVAAQAAAAKIELMVRPSIAPAVAADPVRLNQALINLLSNAIKFTPPGGRVSIGATVRDDAVAFEVTDTGIGMTPDQIDIAKLPFRMIENCLTRRHSGIGLGLPLAERLVRLQGGELRIDSRPGSGTSVTATLPASGETP